VAGPAGRVAVEALGEEGRDEVGEADHDDDQECGEGQLPDQRLEAVDDPVDPVGFGASGPPIGVRRPRTGQDGA